MPALLLNSIPEVLHTRLQQHAAAHQRSITEEVIHVLEVAYASDPVTEITNSPTPQPIQVTYWSKRKPSPEYVAMMQSGAFSGGTDSTVMISEERDAR